LQCLDKGTIIEVSVETNKVQEIHIKQSPKSLSLELVNLCFPITLLLAIFIVFFAFFIPKLFPLYLSVILIFLLLLLFTGLLFVSATTCKMRWRGKSYIITPDQIVIVDGVWSKRHRASNLKGMVGMTLEQTFMAKMLGFGTVSVKFMGGGELNIRNIDEPETVMNYISEMARNGFVTRTVSDPE